VPVEQVNGDFIGCVVPAGQHNVSLAFRPAHLLLGKIISVCGVMLAAMLAASSKMRS
jgi:uncharacterized membrane protein YfhO